MNTNFDHSGFYPFGEDPGHEADLLSKCVNLTIADANKTLASNHALYFLHMNCRSLRRHITDIDALLHSLLIKPVLLFLTETWLDSSHSCLPLAGYTGIHCARAKQRGGGVSIFYSNLCTVLSIAVRTHVTSFEFIAVLVTLPNKQNIIAVCIYRPPSSDLQCYLDEFEKLIDELTSMYSSPLIVGGDFNVDLLVKNDCTSQFLSVMTSLSLYPAIYKCTRPCSGSLLDNFFISLPDFLVSAVLSVDIADHLPIVLSIASTDQLLKSKKPIHKARHFNNINYSRFRSMLQLEGWGEVYASNDVNHAYDSFLNKFSSLFNTAFPLLTKKSDNPRKPCITYGLLNSAKKRSEYYKLYMKNQISKEKYVAFRNVFTNLIRLAKKNYYENLFTNSTNLSRAWKEIKLIRGERSNSSVSEVDPELLNNFFADLGSNTVKDFPKPIYQEYMSNMPNIINSFFMMETNPQEIVTCCNALSPKKSCCFDEISVELLQRVIDIICFPLAHVFNLSLNIGVFPDKLKIAKIVPIHKSGSVHDLINYRPISILPSLSKILERLVYNRMIAYLNKNNILTDAQFGFRQGRSTEHALIDVVNFVSNSLDQSSNVFALYLDVSKAFDSISHSILLHKLQSYGFRGIALSWFGSYLTNRLQYVSSCNKTSNLRIISHGVPQGSIIGPLLFLLYINDLALIPSAAHFVLFADDTSALIPVSPHTDNSLLLNSECSMIFQWFYWNRLLINCTKTKCMYFTLHRYCPKPPAINVNNSILQYVTCFKLLGCFVSDNLKWNVHIDHVLCQVAKGVGMLACVRHYFPINIKRMIYIAFVNSYLLYCISIWGNAASYLINKLLVMQKKLFVWFIMLII